MILLFELPEKFSVVSQRLAIDVLTNGQAKFVPNFRAAGVSGNHSHLEYLYGLAAEGESSMDMNP
jgi:hypothetical protein